MPLAQDIDGMKSAIEKNNIKLIIIDSLGLACGGELKEAQPAMEFFKALRSINTTSLILAHSPKDNENIKKKSIYGSMFFKAQSRNVWEIQKQQDEGSSVAHISLFHNKPAPFQNIHKPIGFQFVYSERSLSIDVEDPKTIDEFLQRMFTSDRILALLKDNNLTQKEMKESTGLSYPTIGMALKRLINKNKVVKLSDDKYSLNQSPPPYQDNS